MILKRVAKPTLTPFELNIGSVIAFELPCGREWEMELVNVSSEVTARGFDRYSDAGHASGDITAYAFEAEVRVNGRPMTMRREVGTQASFYDPREVDGVRIWFDAAACTFKGYGGFMEEKDWRGRALCKPALQTRWAVQAVGMEICPEPLHDWYPNPSGTIDIRNCYTGEDCWMGPYNGGAAHGGLDINMPKGTVLTAPISFNDHYLHNSVKSGFNNNRWMGIRHWADGSTWELMTSHLIDMLAPECTLLPRGTPYATTAGTHVGFHEHTHFGWRVIEQGGAYFLDPWIFMREIWAQRKFLGDAPKTGVGG
ncbi:MAG: hypothetical protein ACOX9C_06250 [Kiritimatiellia bacterium]|jgi:hypothetical protein